MAETFSIIHLTETHSTNSAIAAHAKQYPASTIVALYTDFQTQGRGQQGNTWESNKGENILLSLHFTPALPANRQFGISKAVALGVMDFVKTYTSLPIYIKWPNDIYVGNNKIAGILIENTLMGHQLCNCTVGIGLNVNQTQFSANIPNPISLRNITGITYNIEECVHSLCTAVVHRYEQLLLHPEIINNEYLQHLYRLNEYHSYIYNEEQISAKITGVSDVGFLQLQTKVGNTIECDLCEIKYII